MTRRRYQRGQEAGEETVYVRSPAGVDFVQFWLLASLLSLGNSYQWLSERWLMVSWPVRSPLAPQWSWNVPWGLLAEQGWPCELPQFFFAIAAGACVAGLSLGVFRRYGYPAGLFALTIWSLTLSPRHLVTATLFLVLVLLTDRADSRSRRLWMLVVWAAVCPLLTLDFGWLWLSAAIFCLPVLLRDERRRGVVVAALLTGVAMIGIACYLQFGFLMALTRPVNWIWYQPPAGLGDSSGVRGQTGGELASVCFLGLMLLCWWIEQLRRKEASRTTVWGLAVQTALGLACSYYLWLATWGVASLYRLAPGQNSARVTREQKRLLPILLTLAIARLGFDWLYILADLAEIRVDNDRIDPLQWSFSGPVLLKNLQQSADWQTVALCRRFPLVATDRWDVFGPVYPEFGRLCRDIIETRNESYPLDDGHWGGYYAWISREKPVLLVLDSRDLADLRHLSLNPHWSLLGIDSRRTILARADNPAAQPWLQKTSATLSRIEWPGMSGLPLIGNVLELESAADYRQVAQVLVAWRLPYAALRVLRAKHAALRPDLAALCYLELAHRARRYAGTTSLIDQLRAISAVRQSIAGGWSSPELKQAVERNLLSIGLPELAAEVSGRELTEAAASSSGLTGELLLRERLRRGQIEASKELIPDLETAAQPFYQFLLEMNLQTLPAAEQRLERVLSAADFPQRLRSEGEFYWGCLLIELGAPPDAAQALTRSLEADPESPFGPLCRLYLQQIMKL